MTKLLIDLVPLLHERLHGRVLFLHDGLHLRLLVIGQVQLLGEKSHHRSRTAHSEFMAVSGRGRGRVSGGLRPGDSAAQQNG